MLNHPCSLIMRENNLGDYIHPFPFYRFSDRGSHSDGTPADLTAIATIETLAFHADPITRWLYPDPVQYVTHFPDFVTAFGGASCHHATAYYAERCGAALWFPPETGLDIDTIVSVIERTTQPSQQADLFAFLEQMGQYHPTEPHWYLSVLGVDPMQQGMGYGSALMQPVLAQCDRE